MVTVKVGSAALVVGGAIAWVDSNIGSLFWIVLLVLLADIVVSAAEDAITRSPFSMSSIAPVGRAAFALALPVFIRAFASGQYNAAGIQTSLQLVFGAILVMEAGIFLPKLIALVNLVLSKMLGQNPTEASLAQMADADLEKLAVTIAQRLQAKTGVQLPIAVSSGVAATESASVRVGPSSPGTTTIGGSA